MRGSGTTDTAHRNGSAARPATLPEDGTGGPPPRYAAVDLTFVRVALAQWEEDRPSAAC